MKRQLEFPACVISPSLHLKRRYEAEGFREILYVPHGFEPRDKIAQAPFNGRLVLAYLGNITPVKGADVLLRELKFIRHKQNIMMLFCGRVLDGVYQNRLKTLAKEYPDVDILFKGPYKGNDELKEILADVHVVVFPSVWEENHPLVIKEALLHGVPVLSSSLGGAPEAIADGINGFVFNPYAEGDLAAKINLILGEPAILEKIKEGARNTKIETIDDHTEKMVMIYNDAIKKSSLAKGKERE